MLHFALVGNPNSGKTTLFNSLTGSTARVGNWAGVTVEKTTGKYKKLEEEIEIIDLPGIYSLSPYTPEEIVSRNFIIDEKPDCVINIVDATNLERNLYLTTQLLEMDVPVVIALNMSDAVKKQGKEINIETLSKKLNVPIVEISALKNSGLTELMEVALEASKNPRKGQLIFDNEEISHLISDIKIALSLSNISNPLFHAVKLAELDKIEVQSHQDLLPIVDEYKASHKDNIYGDDYETLITAARYKYISKNFSGVIVQKEKTESTTKSDKIDKVFTHKFWGIPIFLVIIFLIFHFTFGNDLFYMGKMGLKIDNEIAVNYFTGMRYSGEAIFGIPSLGVWLHNWLTCGTESLIDLVRLGFTNIGMESSWITGLICDGVLTGLSSVIGFIPQILLLFAFISILEDSGYMARIAFVLDKTFRNIGLSGKAFIPMITGFGCSVPAIMATRTLQDEREKNRTIRLITCFSCGAKAPIWTLLASVATIALGLGDLFIFTIYLGGILIAILCSLFMKALSKDKKVPPLIMELPAYRLPQIKNVGTRVWHKLKHYLIEAGTVIAISLVIIWGLQSFGWDSAGNFGYIPEYIEGSFLAYIGKGITYVFYPLGWTIGEDGWKYMVSAITGLVAKENVVGTMASLGLMKDTISLSTAGIYAFASFNLLTLPCMATIATAKSEQSTKQFIITLLYWFFISYFMSGYIYWVGTLTINIWWLGLIAILSTIAVIVITLFLLNRKTKRNIALAK